MNSRHINHAVRVLKRGGILAYPTEAVYGIGCCPCFERSVFTILQLKSRKISEGLILVGSDFSQFHSMVDIDKLRNKSEILASWPGPVTWILPTKSGVPPWLTGKNDTLAIRISDHPIVRELCNSIGILVSTSANPAGCQPARTTNRVRSYFGNQLDYILPGLVGGRLQPTEIREANSGKVLRSAK